MRRADDTHATSFDARYCAELTRRHARTFSVASRFLSAEKRRGAFAIYAFCRVADDIVDDALPCDRERAREALDRHRQQFIAAQRGQPNGPLFRELSWAVHRFRIPTAPFHSLLDTLAGDLTPAEFTTWEELTRYCGGVASTVGEMCAHVFGLPARRVARADALAHARTLGVALQLTNILRDVGEDAGRNRCYLPAHDLADFQLSRAAVLRGAIDPADAPWRAFMRAYIERARSLYAQAAPGIAMLDADAQCCATMCSRGYAAILGAIERRGYDSLTGRARIGAARKALLMLHVWHTTRQSSAQAAPAALRVADAGTRLHKRVTR